MIRALTQVLAAASLAFAAASFVAVTPASAACMVRVPEFAVEQLGAGAANGAGQVQARPGGQAARRETC